MSLILIRITGELLDTFSQTIIGNNKELFVDDSCL